MCWGTWLFSPSHWSSKMNIARIIENFAKKPQVNQSIPIRHRFLYTTKAILLGLLAAQAIATLHVYLSNIHIYKTTMAIMHEGYFPFPNSQVLPTLKELGPAFWGGLFFTLSIGTGLALLTVACAWIWGRIFKRNIYFLICLIIAWLSVIVVVNRDGFSFLTSLYFLIVPCVTFLAMGRWMPLQSDSKTWISSPCFILPIAVLTLIWWGYKSDTLFLDIRDYLLLSNPIGQKVDRFYYEYTLYPAEAFKSLDQKTLKACYLEYGNDQEYHKRIERALINYDYLPISKKANADFEIRESGNSLHFIHKEKTVLQTTLKDFLLKPIDALQDFSWDIDKLYPFRQATFYSILIGFPILLYVIVFSLIRSITDFLMKESVSSIVTGALCFLIGLALLIPIYWANQKVTSDVDIATGINSEIWQQRVVTLRRFVKEKQDIGRLADYKGIMASAFVPERYWLAQALGISKDPKTYEDLLILLDDAHPNVVSMALRGLGQRKDRRAIKVILDKLKNSDHWYNQWYGYRALKRLGWRQSKDY